MVEENGFEWMDDAFRLIQEDKRDNYLVLMALLPLARTPMDKEGGRAATNYTKDLRRMLFDMTPWDVGGSLRSEYRKKVKSGTIAVVLDDPRLAKDPMFTGAKIIK